jgi:hypothetical protein
MNYSYFEKWLKDKLIQNLPPNSVVVLNVALYHNVQLDPAPTSTSTKAEMQMWLSARNIPFATTILKPELYELKKKIQLPISTYKTDSLLETLDYFVLPRPPYRPDFNPTEMICGTVKK